MRYRSYAVLLAAAAVAACHDSPVAPQDPGEEVVFAIASDEASLGRVNSRGGGTIIFEQGTGIKDTYRFTAVRRLNGTVGGIFEFHHSYLGVTVRAAGDVVCMAVDAYPDEVLVRMGGVVRESNFPEGIPLGSELTWSVTDVGPRTETKHDLASSFLGMDAETYCAYGLPYTEYPLSSGDMVIRARQR